jgi:uncharacterized repeat protein (TIGR01451 family)
MEVNFPTRGSSPYSPYNYEVKLMNRSNLSTFSSPDINFTILPSIYIEKSMDKSDATGTMFHLKYYNNTQNTATNFNLKDILSSNLVYKDGSATLNSQSLTDAADQDAFTKNGTQLNWIIPSIPTNTSGEATFKVTDKVEEIKE